MLAIICREMGVSSFFRVAAVENELTPISPESRGHIHVDELCSVFWKAVCEYCSRTPKVWRDDVVARIHEAKAEMSYWAEVSHFCGAIPLT